MRKILLTLLAIALVLGFFAATGYAGYRLGYARGAQATGNGDVFQPGFRPFEDFGPRGMHNFGFERSFPRGRGPGGFPWMGFGFFAPLMFLGRILVLGLIIWFVYWLLARSGWRLTRQTTENSPPRPKNE